MTASHGAHASLITVAGRQYRVRREFELICRIEELFGPVRDFGARLEESRFTMRELAALYKALLADQPEPPAEADIQRHIVDVGILGIVKDLHPLVTAFFFGETRFMKRLADRAAPPDPPMAPASSTGANFSEPPPAWDGRPQNSGARPSTS